MNILTLKPKMSEKTYVLSNDGVYVFEVDKEFNKHQISDAVEKTYKVTVTKIRTVTSKGKQKRSYRNRKYEIGTRSDTKKAYVTLKEGDAIPIFAAVEEAEQKAEKTTKTLEKVSEKNAKKEAKKEAKEAKKAKKETK
jgi:large subunit ribosomal protein L23